MKKLLILTIFYMLYYDSVQSQPRFNRVYRMFTVDSTGDQGATVFNSLRVVDNQIYIAGTAIRGIDSLFSNSGIFTSFNMLGDTLKNTYYGFIPTNSDFNNDVILLETNNQFSLVGYNFEHSFTFWKVNKEGDTLLKRTYRSIDTAYWFGPSPNCVKIDDKYFFASHTAYSDSSNFLFYSIDSQGNTIRNIEYDAPLKTNSTRQLIKNQKNNLVLCLYSTTSRSQDTNYIYISQLRELDTMGNILWTYSTPRNRYIYFKKFIQLANGNYLAWGDEELSRIVGRFRNNYLVGPYIAEINPQRGIVWERLFNLGSSSRMYGFKLLKDSSMILASSYDDGPNNASSCIIKLNKNQDSIYRRNFRPTSIISDRVVPFPNQIEELENGDLLISGYVEDRMTNSPTVGQWGWLVRTDSMGCSLEPSSCRTPTKDIKEYPLSIKTFPNPTSSNLTIDFDIQASFKTASFSLIDITGREILNQKIDNSQKQVVWQTESLQQGLYFVILKVDNEIVYQTKVSVQK